VSYTRLPVDERRRRLLELGAELFVRHDYGDLSMARIAREAGISKALLYHYFPSKQEFFVATLALAAEELRALTEPDPGLAPQAALRASLDAYLGWIEANPAAYVKLIESATGHREVRDLIVSIRATTAARILDGLSPGAPPPPRVRAAVRAWLWFMDGACTDWVEHGGYTRAQLLELLLGALMGGLAAAAS
jgi:AcrR family transcriptional regulator